VPNDPKLPAHLDEPVSIGRIDVRVRDDGARIAKPPSELGPDGSRDRRIPIE
jgi:hypothetical protein